MWFFKFSNRRNFSKRECSSSFRLSGQPEIISDGYSSNESSGDDFISAAKLVSVSPEDNDRETDEIWEIPYN